MRSPRHQGAFGGGILKGMRLRRHVVLGKSCRKMITCDGKSGATGFPPSQGAARGREPCGTHLRTSHNAPSVQVLRDASQRCYPYSGTAGRLVIGARSAAFDNAAQGPEELPMTMMTFPRLVALTA